MACHEGLQCAAWAIVGACTLRLLPAGGPNLHLWRVRSLKQLLRDLLLLGQPCLLRHLQLLRRLHSLGQLLLLVSNLVRVQRWGRRTHRQLLHHGHVSSMLHWLQ